MAGVTWLHASGDGATAVQTRTASSLAFTAGDRVLVVGMAMSNGNGDVFAGGVTSTASTNSPTWSALATCATNTTSSSAFCTKLVAFISDALTANETFDVTFDPQTGSANTYFQALGVARLTSVGAVVQAGTDISSNFNDSTTLVTPAGAATSGNLVVMVIAGAGGTAPTYDTPPSTFSTVSGSTMTPTGNMHFSAIASTTATASSFAWGFTSTGSDYNMAAFSAELADAGAPAITSQSHYRWGLDDGSESAHTFAAAEDTAISAAAAQRRLLRVQVDNNTAGDITAAYRLQYKRTDEPATEWRDI